MDPIEGYVVRDYLPGDYQDVAEVWRQTGMGSAQRGDSAAVIEATLALGGRLLVLADRASRELVGTSWLTVDGRRLYLHHFAIRPDRQGRGLARPLLEASLAFARQAGLQIKLEVHRDNRRAIDLYLRAGFRPLGDYDVYIIRDWGTAEAPAVPADPPGGAGG